MDKYSFVIICYWLVVGVLWVMLSIATIEAIQKGLSKYTESTEVLIANPRLHMLCIVFPLLYAVRALWWHTGRYTPRRMLVTFWVAIRYNMTFEQWATWQDELSDNQRTHKGL